MIYTLKNSNGKAVIDKPIDTDNFNKLTKIADIYFKNENIKQIKVSFNKNGIPRILDIT